MASGYGNEEKLSDLLERLGLADRMTTKIEDTENINDKAIDYAKVDEQLKAHREVVNTIIANTKGDGEKSGEDFWVKAERLLYCALIGYMAVLTIIRRNRVSSEIGFQSLTACTSSWKSENRKVSPSSNSSRREAGRTEKT